MYKYNGKVLESLYETRLTPELTKPWSIYRFCTNSLVPIYPIAIFLSNSVLYKEMNEKKEWMNRRGELVSTRLPFSYI